MKGGSGTDTVADHNLAWIVDGFSASDLSGSRRFGRRRELPEGARSQVEEVLGEYGAAVELLRQSLVRLSSLQRQRLAGRVEDEIARVDVAARHLAEARDRLASQDIASCGSSLREAHGALAELGGPTAIAINQELERAAFSREQKAELEANRTQRHEALEAVAMAQQSSRRAAALATARVHRLSAAWLGLAADILSVQASPLPPAVRAVASSDGEARIIPPQELETWADVGGLEEPKAHLRRTVGAVLERPAEGWGPSVRHNGILLHGPPGTGKTLLARATAGEYGLRFVRFSPALVSSPYQSEPARKLRQVFVTAAEAAPCLLFLDEVDSIAPRREGVASPGFRELVTQLLNCLEDFREVPGLVIMGATNLLDQLDPALREGRFDSRIAVPLPDCDARREILRVQVERRRSPTAELDLHDIAQRTSSRSGAALASIVSGAAERALARGDALTQEDLLAEIGSRSGQDRAQALEEQVGWEDVVLTDATRQRLQEILLVFQNPELGRSLGVQPPAGILLYGPPGTGKTTIARALATEGRASFYEQTAADLISKWVGESEQKVAQLFSRARANRPSIIFCDEIDALLKRRSADSSSPWEDRVISQFLRELDGLQSGEGVLLVGATNRPDIIDEAVRQRRLVPIEVPLPDAAGRQRLLGVLCRSVRLDADVDLEAIAAHTCGMSGADLESLRNAAGMKALTRAAMAGSAQDARVTHADFEAALSERAPAR